MNTLVRRHDHRGIRGISLNMLANRAAAECTLVVASRVGVALDELLPVLAPAIAILKNFNRASCANDEFAILARARVAASSVLERDVGQAPRRRGWWWHGAAAAIHTATLGIRLHRLRRWG